MTLKLTEEQARGLWLRGQGLLSAQWMGADAPVAVAHRLCGLQAQDIFAATLGVRCRSNRATMDDVERARGETRHLLWTWAMRGTLHLLDARDAGWLLPLMGPFFVAAAARRRQQLGLDEDTYTRGLQAVRERLAGYGPSTREELVGALASAGITEGYRIERHLLYRAALEGVICLGPDLGAKPTYVLLGDWLGHPRQSMSTEAALAELAARYLAAYAPATPADLIAWSGLPTGAVRTGWAAVKARLTEVDVAGHTAWLPSDRLTELDEAPPALPHVRLLPAFDVYLLSHKGRDLIIDPANGLRINAGGGMIKPVILVNGYVQGIWLANRKGRRVNITVDPFEPLPPEVQAGIDTEITGIERFTA
jgi:hypothetical protein